MFSSSLRTGLPLTFLCLLLFLRPAPLLSFEVAEVREILRTKDHGILSPGAICPLGSGAILITDRAGRTLSCFSREGKLLWKTDGTETGEKGFLDPVSVTSSSSLSLFVLDRGLRKILRFDGRGAFQGYLQSDHLYSPACLAQGEGGELYLYDALTWELICLDMGGSLRWKVKPPKVAGGASWLRVSQGEIHLLLAETGTIVRYGRFGEFLAEMRLPPPAGEAPASLTSFWKSADGSLYATTGDGRLLVYDALSNPVASLEAPGGHRLEFPCDLFISGRSLFLLDCGSGTLYEIILN